MRHRKQNPAIQPSQAHISWLPDPRVSPDDPPQDHPAEPRWDHPTLNWPGDLKDCGVRNSSNKTQFTVPTLLLRSTAVHPDTNFQGELRNMISLSLDLALYKKGLDSFCQCLGSKIAVFLWYLEIITPIFVSSLFFFILFPEWWSSGNNRISQVICSSVDSFK